MIMTDRAVIARLLGVIRAYDGRPFDVAAVSPSALGCDEATRDLLACKLQDVGLVDGLITTGGVDGCEAREVMWGESSPGITLAGIERIES